MIISQRLYELVDDNALYISDMIVARRLENIEDLPRSQVLTLLITIRNWHKLNAQDKTTILEDVTSSVKENAE
jgi:hypothetical protein